jgi:hypothetical protein
MRHSQFVVCPCYNDDSTSTRVCQCSHPKEQHSRGVCTVGAAEQPLTVHAPGNHACVVCTSTEAVNRDRVTGSALCGGCRHQFGRFTKNGNLGEALAGENRARFKLLQLAGRQRPQNAEQPGPTNYASTGPHGPSASRSLAPGSFYENRLQNLQRQRWGWTQAEYTAPHPGLPTLQKCAVPSCTNAKGLGVAYGSSARVCDGCRKYFKRKAMTDTSRIREMESIGMRITTTQKGQETPDHTRRVDERWPEHPADDQWTGGPSGYGDGGHSPRATNPTLPAYPYAPPPGAAPQQCALPGCYNTRGLCFAYGAREKVCDPCRKYFQRHRTGHSPRYMAMEALGMRHEPVPEVSSRRNAAFPNGEFAIEPITDDEFAIEPITDDEFAIEPITDDEMGNGAYAFAAGPAIRKGDSRKRSRSRDQPTDDSLLTDDEFGIDASAAPDWTGHGAYASAAGPAVPFWTGHGAYASAAGPAGRTYGRDDGSRKRARSNDRYPELLATARRR